MSHKPAAAEFLAKQKEYVYQLRGRVVGDDGRPMAGAVVFLNPLKEDDQIFGFTTGRDGTFYIKERTPVRRPTRLLYVTGQIPDNAVGFIAPPFNLLPRITEREFAGRKVSMKENREVNLGDVPIQVRYRRVVIYLRNKSEAPLLTSENEWRSVWLRLRNSRGSVVQKNSLSEVDIQRAVTVAESSIAIAVPEGRWIVEASVNGSRGPWMRPPDAPKVTEPPSAISLILKTKRN